MRYFIPKLILGVLAPAQTAYQDKFGGFPWGLPQHLWPKCRECGSHMVLHAQLAHHDERLDLGRANRVLHLFCCDKPETECVTADDESGTNICFVLEPEQMTSGITYPPGVTDPSRTVFWSNANCGYHREQGRPDVVWFLTEARVMEWVAREDGLREDQRRFFETREGFWDRPEDLPKQHSGTRLGGVPTWIQEPEKEGWRFLGQIGGGYRFEGPIPSPDEIGCPVGTGRLGIDFGYRQPERKRFDGPRYVATIDSPTAVGPDRVLEDTWAAEGPTYGDGGIGYLLCKSESAEIPECAFLWQCC